MSYINHFLTTLLAISVLAVILVQVQRVKESAGVPGKLFIYLSYCVIAGNLFDSIGWYVDGSPDPLYIFIGKLSTVLLFTVNALALTFAILYTEYQIHADQKRLRSTAKVLLVTICMNTLLAFISPFTGFLFSIDSKGVFHRENGYYIVFGLYSVMMLYSIILLVFNWKKIPSTNRWTLIGFSVPPLFGIIFQLIFYGTSVVWPFIVVSMVILYAGLQNRQIVSDYLTGLYNRRELDRGLQRRMRDLSENKILGILMVDIDNFKKINDTYGHSMGDHALEVVADLLRRCFHQNDFLARYGGDEFVCLLEIEDETGLDISTRRLLDQIEVHNRMDVEPFSIQISFGYSIYKLGMELTADEVLERADKAMYINKTKTISR